ncbi:MAG: protein-glutamate O-methyltransferase CheR [Proteobacteria bacterium]|jgi:chemotaxis protein methyltransferase CheR|nr:protein-glutamate O-methyltransferase CheR [Pseudomonadota bacterium]NLN63092.1 protein-glutamate O-methyltransferase CheR [Myxococcales bacterium]
MTKAKAPRSVSRPHDPAQLLSDAQFQCIRQLINQRFGIAFGDDERFMVASRLGERLRDLRCDTFAAYCERLTCPETSGEELDRAVEFLTTNETYFFREAYQLRAFCDDILPELHRRNRASRRLLLWSAGCSSGEEAYTLAMLVADSPLFRDWEVRIFGSDINTRMLAKARAGVFTESSFRSTPPEMRARHFTATDAGLCVNDDIRALCHFARLNVLDRDNGYFVGRADAIFCRNMLIYFDQRSRQTCLANLYDRLVPGGYLLLGHSELLLNTDTAFEPVHLSEDLVYRRPERPHE